MDKSKSQILTTLGRLIKQRRMKLGISQEELGFRSNLDRTYISGLERGVRNSSLTVLVSLADGMGISVSELLDNLEYVGVNSILSHLI
ncbi:MAG: helix-turn-helix transcriptional regulator [Okeania sp. SIO3C4]|nr:helix-turn-helix transcriptional regulator [Okeania sp. SIO3B3]NER07197.1 helix-turn-helix transcriptional regulator [Okeania sp. SIO3C4]